MNAVGEAVPGFDLLSTKNNAHGYQASYYWPSGQPREKIAPKFDPEKERQRRLEEEKQRERAAGWAREVWARAGKARNAEDHPRARAYFAARGVALEALPAGRLPGTLRFTPMLPRDEVEAVHKVKDPVTGRTKTKTVYRDPKPCYPAIVCAGVGYHVTEQGECKRCVRCLQRIYLDEGGEAKKITHGEQKKCIGPTGGAAVRLSEPDVKHGLLVLCEGIETGMGLLAAMGREDGTWPAVWACISTSGLMTAELGDEDLKWVRRVVIAGDHDGMDVKRGHRPGEFAARACQKRLLKRHPNLPGGVDVALPGHRVAPQWVRADGWVVMGQAENVVDPSPSRAIEVGVAEGKSVDWLDLVGACGAKAGAMVMEEAERDRGERGASASTTQAAAAGSPPAPPGGGNGEGDDGAGDWERRRIVDGTRHSVAQALLEEAFLADSVASGGGCWSLRHYAGKWWRWVPPERGAPRYVEASEAWLVAEATRVMDQFRIRTSRTVKMLCPKPADVNAALAASVYYTAVPDGSMPTWIGEEITGQGKPTWESSLAWGDERPQGPIAAASVVAVRNGLLDVDRWVDGQVRLLPPSPRWFSRSCLPFALPVEELEAAEVASREEASMAPVDALLHRLCPTWMRFLDMVSAGEEDEAGKTLWKQTLQRWFGYVLTPDISLERVLMIQGAPGTGKGTISEAMAGVVGEDNVLATTLDKIAGRFDLPAMVGRAMVSIPELRVGGYTDIAAALDTLNSISGGDPQSVEAKFGARQAYVRMSAKFVITPNETPKLPDPANALVRRLVVLKMAPPPAKRDPELKRAIKGEKLGIMLWALYGLRDLRVQMALGNDPFEMPAESQGVIDDVRRSASPVMAFVEDECVVGSDRSVGTRELYEAYKRYAEEHGHGEPSDITFGRQLAAAMPAVRKDKGGGRAARYVGLDLKLQVMRAEPDENVFGIRLPPP